MGGLSGLTFNPFEDLQNVVHGGGKIQNINLKATFLIQSIHDWMTN